nr:hypothetical protein TetV2_00038 [Oceanusvirus sp.]
MMTVSEFCAGDLPDIDACHARGIVPVGVHAGLTYEQMLANTSTLEYCRVLAEETTTPIVDHLQPFLSWLRENDRLSRKRKADIDEFDGMTDAEKGAKILTAGKHRGQTFSEVVQYHPDYCRNVIQRFGDSPLSTDMRHFVHYLKSVDLQEQPIDPNAADRGGCAIDFGRTQRNKTYQEVLDSDIRYCRWVVSEDRTGSMKRFAEFLKASGVTPEESAPAAAAEA